VIIEVMEHSVVGITTGRMSCSKPNNFNVPRSSGMKMKSARNMHRYARRSGETLKTFRDWARDNLSECRTGSEKLLSILRVSR
jgi:hypothetical protein